MKIKENELLDLKNTKIDGDTSEIDEILEYEEILFEISKSLVNYRKENNLTQKQLAEILDVKQVMISKLESGNYNPTFKLLHRISRKLTNSTEMFIDTLNSVIEALNQMYELGYEFTIENKDYDDIDGNKVIYMDKYNFDIQGGYYGSEKCTSSDSVAG